MATVKVKFRPSSVQGKAGTIYYQIIHCRIVRQITTDIHIYPYEWDKSGMRLVSVAGENGLIQNRIDSDILLLRRIITRLETLQKSTGRVFSAQNIISCFRMPEQYVSVLDFMQEQIRSLIEANRQGTARNYRKTLDCLRHFLGGRDICFCEITSRLVEKYDAFLRCRGMARNSVSFYMRILRTVYNKAVERGIAEQHFPFGNVYTGIDRTRKRAVGKNIIARLIRQDLTDSAPLALARDLFLFSFYTRGMAFVDMAYLRTENLKNGMIHYVRRKTGQSLVVCIEPCIQTIIERYAGSGNGYLFPILKSEDPNTAYCQYQVALAYYNRLLKKISVRMGLEGGLSFHAARHSWATMARNLNVPVSVISASMGHTSERTTQIYLAMLENSIIDNANRGVLNTVNRTSAYPCSV